MWVLTKAFPRLIKYNLKKLDDENKQNFGAALLTLVSCQCIILAENDFFTKKYPEIFASLFKYEGASTFKFGFRDFSQFISELS